MLSLHAGGATLEVTLAQFWSSAGESSLAVEVLFHGVRCSPDSILLDGSQGIRKFFVEQVPLITLRHGLPLLLSIQSSWSSIRQHCYFAHP